MSTSGTLAYDVFIADPIPQNVTEPVPNGDRRMFSLCPSPSSTASGTPSWSIRR